MRIEYANNEFQTYEEMEPGTVIEQSDRYYMKTDGIHTETDCIAFIDLEDGSLLSLKKNISSVTVNCSLLIR